MSHRKVRTYDKEFKLNAIKLYIESGRTYKEIGDELGIPPSNEKDTSCSTCRFAVTKSNTWDKYF